MPLLMPAICGRGMRGARARKPKTTSPITGRRVYGPSEVGDAPRRGPDRGVGQVVERQGERCRRVLLRSRPRRRRDGRSAKSTTSASIGSPPRLGPPRSHARPTPRRGRIGSLPWSGRDVNHCGDLAPFGPKRSKAACRETPSVLPISDHVAPWSSATWTARRRPSRAASNAFDADATIWSRCVLSCGVKVLATQGVCSAAMSQQACGSGLPVGGACASKPKYELLSSRAARLT